MFFTTTFTVALILIFVALSNFLWLLLMPSKGEKHPMVETIHEIERAIKRSEEKDEVNWGVMRKQIQQQRMRLSLVQNSQHMAIEDMHNLQNLLDSLYSYIEGNWRLYEMKDEPVVVKRFYDESMNKIKGLSGNQLAVTVLLDPETEDSRKIDMSKSLSELHQLISSQSLFLEKEYGLS